MLADLQQKQLRRFVDEKRNRRRRNLRRTSQFDVKRKEIMGGGQETERSTMYWKHQEEKMKLIRNQQGCKLCPW